MIRLSFTARTPGVLSTNTRTAFFSVSESTISPQVDRPVMNDQLISAGLVHCSRSSFELSLARMLVVVGGRSGNAFEACERLQEIGAAHDP